jgi:OFA family oxalate/formate antiporter-like MFS transporter
MNRRSGGIAAVTGGCLAVAGPGVLVFGHTGVMGSHWQQAFGVGRAAVGANMFFVLAGAGTFMFLVGRWQVRYGTRRMVRIGAIISALSLVLAAYAPGMSAIYLWALAVGASSSFAYLPSITVAQLWWPDRRGLVSGLVNFSFAAGAALLSPLLGWALRTLGYAPTNLLLAPVILIVGAWAARHAAGPAEAIPSRSTPAGVVRSYTLGESVRTSSFWFLWATWALQGAAGIAMVTLAAPLGRSQGFALEVSLVLLTAFNLGSGVSRLLMGYLSDALGRNLSMSATFFASAAAYLALPHAQGIAFLIALTTVVGFGFGTLFAVSAPLALECFGPLHFGAVFGLVFTAYGYLSGALGPWLSGYLLDATGGNINLVCGYLGIFCVVSGFSILGVRPGRVS